MQDETIVLLGLAASIGFVHTLFGPDHYLPFIVLSKARKWSAARTAVVTALCGIGHVLSSVVLGCVGIAAGVAVTSIKGVEGFRGEVAAWMLFAFGIAYLAWGVRRAIRSAPHRHAHVHAGDHASHEHEHGHAGEHAHPHGEGLTPWVLFIVFVFGPCEPLIPILMYPAAAGSGWAAVVAIAAVFSVATIGTMTAVVMASYYGLSFLPLKRFERYTHAAAGAAITLSASAIIFLGL